MDWCLEFPKNVRRLQPTMKCIDICRGTTSSLNNVRIQTVRQSIRPSIRPIKTCKLISGDQMDCNWVVLVQKNHARIIGTSATSAAKTEAPLGSAAFGRCRKNKETWSPLMGFSPWKWVYHGIIQSGPWPDLTGSAMTSQRGYISMV